MQFNNRFSFFGLVLCLTLANSAHAGERVLHVSCEKPSLSTINRFASEGDLKISENNEVSGALTLQASLSGSNDSYDMGAENVKGSIKVIPAGQLFVDEVSILQLSADDDGIMNYRLVLGSKGDALSSLLVDGTIYKSNCSVK